MSEKGLVQGPPVEKGKKLDGLKLGSELRDGKKFWEQVIDSEFGQLR